MRLAVLASLLVVISLLCSGCGASRQKVLDSTMNAWIGAHRDDLINAWGPPAQETRLSNGGSILTYRSGGQVNAPMDNTVVGVPVSCQKDIETDSMGKIVRWHYQGNC
jgi:hypothetical protein